MIATGRPASSRPRRDQGRLTSVTRFRTTSSRAPGSAGTRRRRSSATWAGSRSSGRDRGDLGGSGGRTPGAAPAGPAGSIFVSRARVRGRQEADRQRSAPRSRVLAGLVRTRVRLRLLAAAVRRRLGVARGTELEDSPPDAPESPPTVRRPSRHPPLPWLRNRSSRSPILEVHRHRVEDPLDRRRTPRRSRPGHRTCSGSPRRCGR